MIEQQGIVTEISGNMAAVTRRSGDGCGSCNGSAGCGQASLARFFQRRERTFWVTNSIDARTGDRVVVGLDDAPFLRTAALAYALPVLGLLLGAIIGDQVASTGFEEPMAIASSLTGLIVGLRFARRLSVHTAANKRHQASVTQILAVNSSKAMVTGANQMPREKI